MVADFFLVAVYVVAYVVGMIIEMIYTILRSPLFPWFAGVVIGVVGLTLFRIYRHAVEGSPAPLYYGEN